MFRAIQLCTVVRCFGKNKSSCKSDRASSKSESERRGRNDVLKALSLANKQAINSSENYVSNRQVSREDAIAGMMMDRVNLGGKS